MNKLKDFLDVARSQLGGYYPKESPYGIWYADKVGNPVYRTGQYCAMFVSWCADRAGILNTVIPLHAYTPAGAAWFKARKRFVYGMKGIQPGYIWYSSMSGLGRISHVGIVESVNRDGSINTIEGNTAGDYNGDQRNGKMVARKVRYSTGSLGGYGIPDYSAAIIDIPTELIPAPITNPVTKEEEHMTKVLISTTTPWGTKAYAELRGGNLGATAIDALAWLIKTPVFPWRDVPWDAWNYLVSDAWNDNITWRRQLGEEVRETAEELTEKLIAKLPELLTEVDKNDNN